MKLFRQVTLLVMVFPILSISAQSGFRVGEIITNNNDTISGYIDTKTESGLFRECRFKTKENSPVSTYTPETIKAFSIGGSAPRKFVGTTYLSVSNEVVFLEILSEGDLNLYYRKEGAVKYFIQRKGETAIHSLPYQRMERYVDDGYTRQLKIIETVYHMDTLKMVMKDKPALYDYIEKIQSPERNSLIALVNKYNSTSFQIVISPIRRNQPVSEKTELLRKGKINLYMSTDSASEQHFYIRKGEGAQLVGLQFKKDENQTYRGVLIRSYANNTTNHIDTLKKYMADAAPLFATIDDIRFLSRNKLVKLVDEYNSYIDEDTYNKANSLKRIPFNIDVVPGFNSTIINPQDPTVRLGALLDIGFVNSNVHYFFKTGLSVFTANTPLTDRYFISTQEFQEYHGPARTLKIPLQVEYRFSEKTIQPIISMGYNLYLIKEVNPYNVVLLPAISPGINVQMGKRFSICLGVEIEFTNNNLISYFPTELKRASLFAGLQIKL
jgi:hypothetical protein